MSVPLLERRVRFGDTTYGPCLHYATVFDWIICTIEEFGEELDYTCDEIVSKGGIPYGPVAVTAKMDRYPTYGDRVRISAVPLYVSDRSFQVEYELSRITNGERLGRVRVVSVTLAPDGTSEPLPMHVEDHLKKLADRDARPDRLDSLDDSPVTFAAEDETFTIRRSFRSPHVEAVDLGYFEDYAQFMAVALEDYLAATSPSLAALCETTDSWPFQPREWRLTFHDMVHFEDEMTIRGYVESPETAIVAYAFDGESDADRRLAGRIAYGCCDDNGVFVTPPQAMVDALEPAR
jgi:acyl-CoA thioesterase FadM